MKYIEKSFTPTENDPDMSGGVFHATIKNENIYA